MKNCRVLGDKFCGTVAIRMCGGAIALSVFVEPRTSLHLLNYGRRDSTASTRAIGRPDRTSPIEFTLIRSSSFAQDFEGQKTTELISTIILATSGVRLTLNVVSIRIGH